MAEKVVYKGGDLDGTLLDNAASEATLLLLTETMQKWAKAQGVSTTNVNRQLESLSRQAARTTDELEDFEDQLENTGSALGSVADFAGRAAMRILSFGTNIVKAGSQLTSWSTGVIQSRPVITDFTGAIANSRLNIFGMGEALDAVTGLLYNNYRTFQELSRTGIALGDRITTLSEDYVNMGIDLETMSSFLSANSQNLARMGTATRGAELALTAGARAFRENSAELQRFGMSFDEQAETFSRFFGNNTLALQRGTMSQDALISGSLEYTKMIRRLSELTGQQADEIEDGLAQANLNRGFERFLSGLDENTQQRFGSIISAMQASFGDAGREAAMAAMMGVAPVTEEARALTAIMPGFGTALDDMIQGGRSFEGSLEEFNEGILNQLNVLANSNESWANDNARLAAILFQSGSAYGSAMAMVIDYINRFGGSLEDARTNLGNLDPSGDIITQFEQTVQRVRSLLNTVFVSFLSQESVQQGMRNFAEWIDNFDTDDYNPFNEEGRENIRQAAETAFRTVGDIISSTVSAAFAGLGLEDWDPMTAEGRQQIIDTFRNFVSDLFLGEEIDTFDEFGDAITRREGGLIRAMIDGFNRLFEDEGILETFRNSAVNMFREASSGLIEFWNNDQSVELRNNISSFFEDIFDQLFSLIRQRVMGFEGGEVGALQDLVGEGLLDTQSMGVFTNARRLLGDDLYDRLTADLSPSERSLWSTGSTANIALQNLLDKARSEEGLTESDTQILREVMEALGQTPSFNSGTRGFENFGSGTLAMLHGMEAVIPLLSPMGEALQYLANMSENTSLSNARNDIPDLSSSIRNIRFNTPDLNDRIQNIRPISSLTTESEPSLDLAEIKNSIENNLSTNRRNQDNPDEGIDKLNKHMMAMIQLLSQINDNSRRQVRATQSLSPNLFTGL